MRTVIFDLDGTLADTSGDLIAAANACFRRLGLGDLLDPEADKAVAFRGGRAMLREGFARAGRDAGDDEIGTEYFRFLDFYAEDIDRTTVLYPGAAAAIEGLLGAGYRAGICTNKPAGLAELLMARLGVREMFGSLIGADTLTVRKPHPAPYRAAVTEAGGSVERSLLVGDTVTDRDTARAAGVPVVLVTFGPGGPGVADLAPDALLADYEALAGVVTRLIG